ncbi:MAG: NIL domain-containing protein [Dehalococcoidia bacterium]|nr:NIL domain-containing protein [Dehalococcoidia bacterium]
MEKHVRLTFSPDLIKEPLIYQLGQEFQVVTNIRMADVDAKVGWVVLSLEGDDAEVQRALDWVRSKGVRIDDATLGDVVEG